MTKLTNENKTHVIKEPKHKGVFTPYRNNCNYERNQLVKSVHIFLDFVILTCELGVF